LLSKIHSPSEFRREGIDADFFAARPSNVRFRRHHFCCAFRQSLDFFSRLLYEIIVSDIEILVTQPCFLLKFFLQKLHCIFIGVLPQNLQMKRQVMFF